MKYGGGGDMGNKSGKHYRGRTYLDTFVQFDNRERALHKL